MIHQLHPRNSKNTLKNYKAISMIRIKISRGKDFRRRCKKASMRMARNYFNLRLQGVRLGTKTENSERNLIFVQECTISCTSRWKNKES